MAGEKLLGMLNSVGGKPSDYSDLIYGTVISSNPLSIKLDNNGMELPESFLEAGKFGKSRSVYIEGLSVNVDGTDHAISGNATIRESLSPGDGVSLVRGHGGQRFYILERT
ncbi:DUF2577 family protein [Lactococcus garvieae]|uniref:DUF2577 family protein n=1 Tax=Lactococcus garvieae TaxID=1363 RepID=UPI001F616E47|nr:DUF2577 family protein [Lactococcus garvieae]MCI3860132.1 DUF2577 domain-containing protein [Lactococcus garvieae]